MLTIGSLFSGIGGLEMGLEQAGLGPVLFQAENNDYAQKVLRKHWPNAIHYWDVRTVCSRIHPDFCPGYVDILCGGPPCVGFSRAGAQGGLDDPRSGLWSEYIRIVRYLVPRYVVFENVAQIQTLHEGQHFKTVVDDLASSGYATAWWRDTALAAGAPHLRERVWLVGWHVGNTDLEGLAGRRLPRSERPDGVAAGSSGRTGTVGSTRSVESGLRRDARGNSYRPHEDRWPALRGQQQHAWEPPRTTLEGRGRRDRLTALGNIAMPVNARVAGELILQLEDRRLKGVAPWTHRTND